MAFERVETVGLPHEPTSPAESGPDDVGWQQDANTEEIGLDMIDSDCYTYSSDRDGVRIRLAKTSRPS